MGIVLSCFKEQSRYEELDKLILEYTNHIYYENQINENLLNDQKDFTSKNNQK